MTDDIPTPADGVTPADKNEKSDRFRRILSQPQEDALPPFDDFDLPKMNEVPQGGEAPLTEKPRLTVWQMARRSSSISMSQTRRGWWERIPCRWRMPHLRHHRSLKPAIRSPCACSARPQLPGRVRRQVIAPRDQGTHRRYPRQGGQRWMPTACRCRAVWMRSIWMPRASLRWLIPGYHKPRKPR